MFQRNEEHFCSEADGLGISVLEIVPENLPYKGIVQLVHGMCEYKERYVPFMEYLAGQGYVTVIHDHRGHGKSVLSVNDLGYMYGGGADALLMDIITVNSNIRKKYPDLPLILFGHSMGSLAVRALAANNDDLMDMLVVCGSPSKNPLRSFGTWIAKIEKTFWGERHKSQLIRFLSFGSFAIRFKKEKNPYAWVCSDPEVYRQYEESDLCGFTFSDDAYLTLFELMKRAYDIKHWNCRNSKMPVLFIAGENDPCIGNPRCYAKAVKAMRKAGYVDVRGKLYAGMRHEILNEKNKEKVYRDVAIYIKRKIK